MNDTYSYDKEEIKEILDYAIRKIEQNISTIKDQQIEIDRLKKELEISRNIPYNYNYEKGAFSQIRFHWDDATRTLTIDDRKGEYKGMLKKRNFRILVVDRQSPSGDKEPTLFSRSVRYNGKAQAIKL